MNITEKLKLKLPIFQAPLLCYPNQEKLVAEVSKNGALGIFSTYFQSLSEIENSINIIQQKTSKSFAILIDLTKTSNEIDIAEQSQANKYLNNTYKDLNINPKSIIQFPDTNDIIKLSINKKPAAIIFANGVPSSNVVYKCKKNNIMVMVITSNILEAIVADSIADVIILQGIESAGLQSRFPNNINTNIFPVNTLLQNAIKNTSKPLVVWGDSQNPQHVVSALINGASSVMIDSLFWTTKESPIPDSYRKAISKKHNEMQVCHSSIWLGQKAQTINNKLIRENRDNKNILPHKKQQQIIYPIIKAAIEQDNPDYMPLWAGLCATSSDKTVSELCDSFISELNEIIS